MLRTYAFPALFLAALAPGLAPGLARAAGNDLAFTNPAYDTTGQKLGTAALARGYGTSSTVYPTSTATWTWEAWFKRPGNPSASIVIIGAAQTGYLGVTSAGLLVCNTYNGNTTISPSGVATDGGWHFARMTESASGMTCQLDGGTAASNAVTQSSSFGTDAPMTIGALMASGSPVAPFTGGEIDEVAFWNTNRSAGTVPVASYAGIEAGLQALYHLDGNGSDSKSSGSSSVAAFSVAPNDPAIFYSPYNWSVTSASATSINAGAYLKVLFSGSSCSMAFNVANDTVPLSEIYYRLDGYETQTPWVASPVAASVPCTPPGATQGFSYHLLEIVVKSTSEGINRWTLPSNTAVVLTGLTFASGATVIAPKTYPERVAIFGDSITEGVRTVNETAPSDTDRNDVLLTWSWALGQHLNAEFGIIGFGASGYTKGGSGNVPAFGTSSTLIMPGVPRVWTPAPDLIVVNHGGNDRGATAVDTQTAATGALGALLAATPATTKIVVLEPFGAFQAQALAATVTAIGNPRLTYLDTTGFFNLGLGADSLGLHPSGPNDLAMIAEQVASAIAPVLRLGSVPTYAGGAHPGAAR